jgi:hypothetical protein
MGDCIGAQPGHRGAVTFFSDFNYNFSMVGLSGKHRTPKASGVLLSTPYTQSVPMMLSCGADNIVKIWDMKRFRTVSEVAVGSQGGALTKAVWVGPNALVTANGGSIRLWERVPEYPSQIPGQSLDSSFMDNSSDAGAVNYVWRSRSLATHAQACTDILSTEHFIASGSKSGQILYWGN